MTSQYHILFMNTLILFSLTESIFQSRSEVAKWPGESSKSGFIFILSLSLPSQETFGKAAKILCLSFFIYKMRTIRVLILQCHVNEQIQVNLSQSKMSTDKAISSLYLCIKKIWFPCLPSQASAIFPFVILKQTIKLISYCNFILPTFDSALSFHTLYGAGAPLPGHLSHYIRHFCGQRQQLLSCSVE